MKSAVIVFPGSNCDRDLAVAIETSSGAAVEQLLQSSCTTYPVNPRSAKAYRHRKAASGAKSDLLDAWSLAEALRVPAHSGAGPSSRPRRAPAPAHRVSVTECARPAARG